MLLERAETDRDARVRREVRTLSAAGFEVVVLHRGDDARQEALRRDGGRVVTVVPRGLAGRVLRALPAAARRGAQWAAYAWRAARTRPDVVHAHDLPMLLPAWAAARASGASLLYDTHEYHAGV